MGERNFSRSNPTRVDEAQLPVEQIQFACQYIPVWLVNVGQIPQFLASIGPPYVSDVEALLLSLDGQRAGAGSGCGAVGPAMAGAKGLGLYS